VRVQGRLRGIAHAGCQGNRQARIVALQLRPLQLRIAEGGGAGAGGSAAPGLRGTGPAAGWSDRDRTRPNPPGACPIWALSDQT
jgi:septum formation inhibitor MinC